MPELPEVETTLRGIAPHIEGQIINGVEIRESRLRWPIPENLGSLISGRRIGRPERRAKYLLLPIDGAGTLIIHLGMSGSLRIVDQSLAPRKHDHVDLRLSNGSSLRYHDPRRFGCLLLTDTPASHALIKDLGPEPLASTFNGAYLHGLSRGRKTAIKTFVMDGHVVVGVGNIYASESLFRAGISPLRLAGEVSLQRYEKLAIAIREVLEAAIQQGGTTLRDFVNPEGKPGYFRQTLKVYERAGEPCRNCETPIRMFRQGQRATYWCPKCQR